jgi:hypothetical protein
MIDLALCMTVKSAELKAHKRHALEVSTPETTFLMFADSEKEKDDWIGIIYFQKIMKERHTQIYRERHMDTLHVSRYRYHTVNNMAQDYTNE